MPQPDNGKKLFMIILIKTRKIIWFNKCSWFKEKKQSLGNLRLKVFNLTKDIDQKTPTCTHRHRYRDISFVVGIAYRSKIFKHIHVYW